MSVVTLIAGLVLLLGTHSLRIVADPWRTKQRERFGEMGWKAIFSLASVIGLGIVVVGYSESRPSSPLLWNSALWARHLAAVFTLPAFILLTAAYVPGTRIKAALGHPMLAGIMLWAGAHLMANGKLCDAILFGGFLLWAFTDYLSCRNRDRAAARRYHVTESWLPDLVVVAVGAAGWWLFAWYGHEWLIGVRPFG